MPKNKEKRKHPISLVVIIVIFFTVIVFLILQGWKEAGPFRSVLGLILVSIMLVHFYFFVMGGWERLPLVYKNKTVIFMDGVVGAAETNIQLEHGGMASLVVAVRKGDAPQDWFRLPGAEGFFAWISGMVHIPITRPIDDFVELNGEYLGVKEGAIFVLGGINEDRPVKILDMEVKNKLEQANWVISKLNTIVQTAVSEASRESQTGTKSLVDAVHTITPILREWNKQRVPSQVLQQPKQEVM